MAAPAAKASFDKPTKNIVHEQAILVETIKKINREQKLFTNFSVNPFTKSMIESFKKKTFKNNFFYFILKERY
jgi:hypothetical protein